MKFRRVRLVGLGRRPLKAEIMGSNPVRATNLINIFFNLLVVLLHVYIEER